MGLSLLGFKNVMTWLLLPIKTGMTSLCLRIREIFLLRSEKEERNWKMKAFIRPFFFSFDIFFAAFSSFLSSFSCDSLVPEVCGAPNKYLVVSLPRLNGENLDKEKKWKWKWRSE